MRGLNNVGVAYPLIIESTATSSAPQQAQQLSKTQISGANYRWQDFAACKYEPTDRFFVDPAFSSLLRQELEKEAKVICAQCAVKEQCLDAALSGKEEHGIWGGLTIEEIARIRRSMSRKDRSQK